ncbi:MAG: HAMP domain-containing histidine kinase [Pseudomonadaceae bacterium]|nr:HAMP domain-containing histidine kinase [Pseudomonadaceae bacterium]
MEFKQGLSQRIVIAFVLMTLLVGGAFSYGIVQAVHIMEERLVSGALRGDLDRMLLMTNMDDWRHKPEPGQLFYFSGGAGKFSLPAYLQNLPEGFQEAYHGKYSYHAYARVVAGRQYVLLQDQSDFENREQALYSVVLVGFLVSIAAAMLLGWLLARKVIEPVVRLAQQVRHRDQLLTLAPPLAPDYADDEVGQLAAAFDDTLGLLRLALEREQLFTSDVSHELRTPLMVLASSCELLLENPSLDARGKAQVLRIERATQGMRELVQAFLLLAREPEQDSALSTQHSLARIADELVQQWREPIESKGLQFIYQPGETSTHTYNAIMLHSVLGNLLRNAWHYTQSGHITLRLYAQGFAVEDSGVGIAEAEQENIFEPFVRGASARGDGLGLGLSLVRRICLSQGWQVTLSSMPPSGCRFQVNLHTH